MLEYEEIQTKGACSKRLMDFGIDGKGNVKLFINHNEFHVQTNQTSTMVSVMKHMMGCTSHLSDQNA